MQRILCGNTQIKPLHWNYRFWAKTFRYSGKSFELIINFNDESHGGIYEQIVHKGELYVGTYSNFGTASVLKFNNGQLNKIGGDGHKGTWVNPGFYSLKNFTSAGKFLVANLHRAPLVSTEITPIWAYNGIDWKPVGRKKATRLG